MPRGSRSPRLGPPPPWRIFFLRQTVNPAVNHRRPVSATTAIAITVAQETRPARMPAGASMVSSETPSDGEAVTAGAGCGAISGRMGCAAPAGTLGAVPVKGAAPGAAGGGTVDAAAPAGAGGAGSRTPGGRACGAPGAAAGTPDAGETAETDRCRSFARSVAEGGTPRAAWRADGIAPPGVRPPGRTADPLPGVIGWPATGRVTCPAAYGLQVGRTDGTAVSGVPACPGPDGRANGVIGPGMPGDSMPTVPADAVAGIAGSGDAGGPVAGGAADESDADGSAEGSGDGSAAAAGSGIAEDTPARGVSAAGDGCPGIEIRRCLPERGAAWRVPAPADTPATPAGARAAALRAAASSVFGTRSIGRPQCLTVGREGSGRMPASRCYGLLPASYAR
jgi:hypothetical protein